MMACAGSSWPSGAACSADSDGGACTGAGAGVSPAVGDVTQRNASLSPSCKVHADLLRCLSHRVLVKHSIEAVVVFQLQKYV